MKSKDVDEGLEFDDVHFVKSGSRPDADVLVWFRNINEKNIITKIIQTRSDGRRPCVDSLCGLGPPLERF